MSCSCYRKINVSLYCIEFELKENSLKTKEMFKFIGSLQKRRFFNRNSEVHCRGSHLEKPIGSFSNDDGEVSENVKKVKGLISKLHNFARASRFFVHFNAVTAGLRRENV